MATRKIAVGSTFIGGDAPILIQSMCSTKTTDIDASVLLIDELTRVGAGLVRLAVDNLNDVAALAEIRKQTSANLSVDLQENFRLAEKVAPYIDKIRYNPGHLYHLEPELCWREKVRYLVQVARDYDCALRVGVNCGSIDPKKEFGTDPIFDSAIEHTEFLENLDFTRFCVSIKDSDPVKVLAANRLFAQKHPEVPLHLGVTEAGMLPMGLLKSRMALEPLLAEGIGATIRVSLTVPTEKKTEEVRSAQLIIDNVRQNTIINPEEVVLPRLNIISCPSCSRVQNGRFVLLAEEVRRAIDFASDVPLTIAIMGCRVNGPGETDDADIGLWCGPDYVNLKSGTDQSGSWSYEQIIEKVVHLVRMKMSK